MKAKRLEMPDQIDIEHDAPNDSVKTSVTRMVSIEGLNVLAGVVAAITAAVAFYGLFQTRPSSPSAADLYNEMVTSDVKALRDKVDDLNSRVKLIAEPPADVADLDVAALRAELKILKDKISVYDAALLDNPTKALSVPLLRKDIDSLSASSSQAIAMMSSQLERVYDQNKWFIGLVATMAVGLLGLAISNFLHNKK